MAKRSSPGESVVHRLADRSQGGLSRRTMPGGGEVYSGPTATRALQSLGARAFTMDRSIFVAEDFNPEDPADAALYAHERHHQLNSGGDGAAQGFYDTEELAARAIERMVLHRSEAGEDFGAILRDVNANIYRHERDVVLRDKVSGTESTGGGGKNSSGSDEAQRAYKALLAQGKDHRQIVNMLADQIVAELSQTNEIQRLQGGSVGFL